MGNILDHTDSMGQAKMFSKAWYNEYFRRAYTSRTHARFCEAVYGRDLCQHGMMDVEEMDFLASLLKRDEQVLEIGCSNGRITEYLVEKAGCSIFGIDYSDVAITQAQDRTQSKADRLRFQCVDLIAGDIPGEEYDTIIAVDCVYFMGDYDGTIKKLNHKLKQGGRMIVAAFQAKEEGDPEDILEPGSTRMARVLQALGLTYRQYDFTPNIRNHWVKNYDFSRSLYREFAAEGNEFLADARIAENGWFKDHAERRTLVRFLYAINHNSDLK
ncbi:MAG: class I SAM-dependent methyltransferase [Nitrospira sp. LK70]|nr:class I SAM-dependent methyltransferase [Nitrospira sp. LK70]